jgi:hypothetical protein
MLATIGSRTSRSYEPLAGLEEDEVFLLEEQELPQLPVAQVPGAGVGTARPRTFRAPVPSSRSSGCPASWSP